MIDVDVAQQIGSVDREVGDRRTEEGEVRSVTVAREFDAPLDDLWSACTDAERIPRWFLPVSGELRVGGRYQLEGNAGGTIESCDPPRSFRATWELRGAVSWIELRLVPLDDGRTRFELEHRSPVEDGGHWERFGPGAVGVGWELGVIGLTLHLASGEAVDPQAFLAWSASEDGRRLIAQSSAAWGEAAIAAGADAAAARAAAERTTAFYTGAPAAGA